MFNFLDLPVICQINVCVQADEDVFLQLKYCKGVEHLFGEESVYCQRIFEERTRRIYSSELCELNYPKIDWSLFYAIAKYIYDQIQIDFHNIFEKLELNGMNCLLEYQMINFFRPKLFDEYRRDIADKACIYGSVDILQWLDIIPTDYYIFEAIRKEHLNIVEWLDKKDFEFENYHMQGARTYGICYNWFIEHNYYPNTMWYGRRPEN